MKRGDKYLPKGADSSHCATFANVPLPCLTSLQRMSTVEKASLFPSTSVPGASVPKATCPSKWEFGGVPLFWRESKTTDFWCAILDMFNAKTVVDFSPGSGALACAAMSRGVKYTGFVDDNKHLAWLQNGLDTAALKFIAKEGEILYMEDLAELIAQHYRDLLESPDEPQGVEGLFDDEDDDLED